MTGRRLHIGAIHGSDGWETMNVSPFPGIDHLGDARDLSRFPDGSFDLVYASHVLEHFDYRDEVDRVLSEWYRVLAPGGILEVSVPDFALLCRLIADESVSSPQDQWNLMRMIMGGHVDRFDYHQSAFTETFLRHFLERNGFVGIERVDDFGHFHDTSIFTYRGIPVSLNMRGRKPKEGVSRLTEISFSIGAGVATHEVRYLLDRSQFTQDSIASHLLAGRLYEPDITIPLLKILQPGDTFIDIGAHVGYFTVMASMAVGETGRVIAVEPDGENRDALLRQISLNRCENVTIVPCCMGDREGDVEFYINSDNDGGHALWNPASHPFNERSRQRVIKRLCRMVTLDSILASRCDIPPIRAIKIDAEGCEAGIIRGGIGTIQRHRVPFLFIEINHHALHEMGTSAAELVSLIASNGYGGYLVTVEGVEITGIRKLPPEAVSWSLPGVFNVLFSRFDLDGS